MAPRALVPVRFLEIDCSDVVEKAASVFAWILSLPQLKHHFFLWHVILVKSIHVIKNYTIQQKLKFQHGNLNGAISILLANDQTLADFCQLHITEYNKKRFEPFAIRIFLGKETVITVYAADKLREEKDVNNGKSP